MVDNTGKWRDEEGLGKHLKCPGVAQAVLTAPGKGSVKNIGRGLLKRRDELASRKTVKQGMWKK